MKMALYCIEYSILILLFSLSGGKIGYFKLEWW